MAAEFQVIGKNPRALFTLKLHRGEGMLLLGMNWKTAAPPRDFSGFAIEYREPGGDRFFALKNRIAFSDEHGSVTSATLSSRLSPFQKFRWVHFPRNAEMPGEFVYRVTPVFMNDNGELSYGEAQEASIELRRETFPGLLNVAFTRGFVSSQAFVDRYGADTLPTLLPENADEGLRFRPTHAEAQEALAWMGFEARKAILGVLDEAVADPDAQVRVVAYDLCEPEVVSRLKKLKGRLKIIIDDSDHHGMADSAESAAEALLGKSAGKANVKRHHMNNLQHNKTIVVDGPLVQAVVCGSTNFTWRGFFVQANNAVVLRGSGAVGPFLGAFDNYWRYDSVKEFGKTESSEWMDLGLEGIDARVAFSPHDKKRNALLKTIAEDIGTTTSSLLYSLAFLYQTPGAVHDAIAGVTLRPDTFVYGMSDKKVKGRLSGIDLQLPDGKVAPVRPSALTRNVPEPFRSEPTGLSGGVGNRMHHKFLVIDFDKPSARVYLGSYNFSEPADARNGENLLLIRDRRITVSYVVEAIRLFDHYHFRVCQEEAKREKRQLNLKRPPRAQGEEPWWAEDYRDGRKIRDRELFA
jgi:phosphatidylserine/phosphatidylglycerophosphate/cardiolipin synthase-like enzyme